MSLNLKLQSSASKNQARHIDLEVKKIEAREARELLNIVQVSARFYAIHRMATHLSIVALPSASLHRVGHGLHELLSVLPTPCSQGRPHQYRNRADTQPTRVSQRARIRRPGWNL